RHGSYLCRREFLLSTRSIANRSTRRGNEPAASAVYEARAFEATSLAFAPGRFNSLQTHPLQEFFMPLNKLLSSIIIAAAAFALSAGAALAQNNDDNNSNSDNANASATVSTNQAIEIAYHAAGVLYGQMNLPDNQRIPDSLLDGAHCIAVFPAVFKEGFIVAGKNGNGIVGCRDDSGDWDAGAPAYFGLSGGSV